ncbi:hypothetical protein BJ878DRAFT_12994 [Calycina marina]|uniref:Uncharacterized protein n=1 Tax=Calycina marina TaxID=1763456 RepID=A0A9P8CGB3_9HELO|nr:hypothetical protein BJ878DRAFT_12994 [Calycina marina]
MLALWSLTTKAQSSCSCHACLNTATQVARRTTTATGRRRLKVSDCFTACYSTILGSAVLLDSVVKDRRNRAWDSAIDEVKESLATDRSRNVDTATVESGDAVQVEAISNYKWRSAAVFKTERWKALDITLNGIVSYRNVAQTELPSDDKKSSQLGPSTSSLVVQRYFVKDANSAKPENLDPKVPASSQLSIANAHLRQIEAATQHQEPEIGQDITSKAEYEARLKADCGFKYRYRNPTSSFHLQQSEKMVAKLVGRLLSRARILTWPHTTKKQIAQMRQLEERIEALQNQHTQLPKYSWPDPVVVRKERGDLYGALTELKRTWTSESNVELMVGKVCYNLLICCAPPDMVIYDILLETFVRTKLPDLGQIVVDSFMSDSRFSPTSSTVRLMLVHYAVKKDLKGFEDVVRRMNAVEGNDLRLKRRLMWKNSKTNNSASSSPNRMVLRYPYIHEVYVPDMGVQDAMIKGYLMLNIIEKAVGIACNNVRQRNDINPATICEITAQSLKRHATHRQKSHFGAPHILVMMLYRISHWPTSVKFWYETADGRRAMHGLRTLSLASGFHRKSWQAWMEFAWNGLKRLMDICQTRDVVRSFAAGVSSIASDVSALLQLNIDKGCYITKAVSHQHLPEPHEHYRTLLEHITTKLAAMASQLDEIQLAIIRMARNHVCNEVKDYQSLPQHYTFSGNATVHENPIPILLANNEEKQSPSQPIYEERVKWREGQKSRRAEKRVAQKKKSVARERKRRMLERTRVQKTVTDRREVSDVHALRMRIERSQEEELLNVQKRKVKIQEKHFKQARRRVTRQRAAVQALRAYDGHIALKRQVHFRARCYSITLRKKEQLLLSHLNLWREALLRYSIKKSGKSNPSLAELNHTEIVERQAKEEEILKSLGVWDKMLLRDQLIDATKVRQQRCIENPLQRLRKSEKQISEGEVRNEVIEGRVRHIQNKTRHARPMIGIAAARKQRMEPAAHMAKARRYHGRSPPNRTEKQAQKTKQLRIEKIERELQNVESRRTRLDYMAAEIVIEPGTKAGGRKLFELRVRRNRENRIRKIQGQLYQIDRRRSRIEHLVENIEARRERAA